jgi:cob(I)alamin adenosyltransferase
VKIYTKTGDGGESSLYGGVRLPKSDLRFEAYGTIDELNSVLGVALSQPDGQKYAGELNKIQLELFNIGAELALGAGQQLRAKPVGQTEIAALENRIDELQNQLPELKHFILPGGANLGAALHQARTIARRAERAVVRLAEQTKLRPELLAYLNRLSDYLFVLARYANFKAGAQEQIWQGQ